MMNKLITTLLAALVLSAGPAAASGGDDILLEPAPINRLDNESLRWVVDFQPGGDFRLRLISNDDGSEAGEVSHRFSFDVWSRHLRPRVVRVRPRIGRVTVEGASPEEESEIRSRLRLTPGRSDSPASIFRERPTSAGRRRSASCSRTF